jgi:hypothetical protein
MPTMLRPVAERTVQRTALRVPIRVPSVPLVQTTTTRIGQDSPLADEPSGSASVTYGTPPKETPWLLYGGIALGLGVVGFIVYQKKFAR